MKERSLFANSAWGIIVQIVRALTGLVFIPLVISKVSMEGYGLYTILLLMTLYQGVLGQLDSGYPNFLINLISKHTHEGTIQKSLIQRIQGGLTILLVLNLILAVIVLPFPEVIASIFKISSSRIDDFYQSMILILISNVFSAWVQMGGVLFVARHRSTTVRKLETLSYFVLVLSSVALLYIEPSLKSLAWGYLASQLFFGLILFVLSRRTFQVPLLPKMPNWNYLREDWGEWRPFFYWRLNGFAHRQSDTTIISFLLGPHWVAVYDIAMKIPSLVKSLLGKVSEALAPFASARRAPEHQPFMKALSERLVQLQVGVGFALVIIVYFFGRELCVAWLGPEQAQLARPFLYATLLNVVLPPSSILVAILMGFGVRHQSFVWAPTIISIVNVVLAVPVTYYFHVEGTILLTILQWVMMSALAIIWSRSLFKFRVRSGTVVWLTVIFISVAWNWMMKALIPESAGRIEFLVYWFFGETLLAAILVGIHFKQIKELRMMMAQKASGASKISK